jgi:flagellar hook-associated protein 3 FlgL
MRIATITFQNNATSQMNNLQADLAKTQNDLATSTRLHSAADDPAAMAQVNALNVQMSASQQYVTNGNYATSTLQLEEQAMSDATNTLQSARDLAVEANNSSLSAAQRADIASTAAAISCSAGRPAARCRSPRTDPRSATSEPPR